jgi:MFS family permease
MAKRVKQIGWEKMIVIGYLLHSVILFFVPLILLFEGKIWWGYCIQILAGIAFGIRQPSTTLGLYISLEDNQKSLGQSFQHTAWLFGAFLGFLLGAIVSKILGGGVTAFYGIYWSATFIAILSGILFWITYPKR